MEDVVGKPVPSKCARREEREEAVACEEQGRVRKGKKEERGKSLTGHGPPICRAAVLLLVQSTEQHGRGECGGPDHGGCREGKERTAGRGREGQSPAASSKTTSRGSTRESRRTWVDDPPACHTCQAEAQHLRGEEEEKAEAGSKLVAATPELVCRSRIDAGDDVLCMKGEEGGRRGGERREGKDQEKKG